MPRPTAGGAVPPRGRSAGHDPVEEDEVESFETDYGRVRLDPSQLMLGELVVTDEGVELEVVGLDPLRLEPAPEVAEDWGE